MVLEKFSLKDKVAIVTGAGRGLGKRMAYALAAAGADVVAVANSSTGGLEETRREIEQLGRGCLPLQANLQETGSCSRIVEKALEEFGRIDILVNNAGIIRRAPILEFSEKDWDDVMDLNARAVFFLSQAAARAMRDLNIRGKIINIASLRVYQGGTLVASYTASKGAVASLTKALANELAVYGINVNAIAPGYMLTDNTLPLQQDPVRNQEILKRTPLGRWGNAEDLDGALVFLASSASDFVTGEIITVDGGWLIR